MCLIVTLKFLWIREAARVMMSEVVWEDKEEGRVFCVLFSIFCSCINMVFDILCEWNEKLVTQKT